eukprot:GFYU01003485.1.p1 GENE.GFYU01003485.1~~GFYU01003485.1.p1  ORF type:complete len:276 (-),score=44.70 GFYU01003485.1:89-916(-)
MSSRTAIVTGGNKGIGLEICRRFLRAGLDVILAARSEERGLAACSELKRENAGYQVEFYQLDITSSASIDAFVGQVKDSLGKVDILVNNAAVAYFQNDPTPFGQQAETTFQPNYYGTKELTQKMLPLLNPGGTVSTLASQGGEMALGQCSKKMQEQLLSPKLTLEELDALAAEFLSTAQKGTHTKAGFANWAYGMSKACIIAYTRILARQLAADGSKRTTFSCCPGYCDTDMTRGKGPKSPFDGSDTPTWLALEGGRAARNGSFYMDRRCRIEMK